MVISNSNKKLMLQLSQLVCAAIVVARCHSRASEGRCARVSHAGPSVYDRPVPSLHVEGSTPTGARTMLDAPLPQETTNFAPPLWRGLPFSTNDSRACISFLKRGMDFRSFIGCELSPLLHEAPPTYKARWGFGKKRQSRLDLIMFMGFRRDSPPALYHTQTNVQWQKITRPRTSCFTSSDLRTNNGVELPIGFTTLYRLHRCTQRTKFLILYISLHYSMYIHLHNKHAIIY